MKILGIIVAIICFGLLVIGHEFGHFSVAKMLGIRVNEFSLGMGPLLWQKKKGETEYSLRALPLGGYCALEGEDEDTKDPGSFAGQPGWKKFLVLFAGSFNNIIIGIIIFTCIFLYAGSYSPKLSEVVEGGPAAKAGIIEGDVIIGINDVKYDDWSEIVAAISGTEGDKVRVSVDRGGKQMDFTCDSYINEAGNKAIGIVCSVDHSLGKSFKGALSECTFMFKELKAFFGRLFSGNASKDDVGSVIQIVAVAGETAEKYGLINVIYIIALVSVNLGFMNLLPIPALDGGRILFVIIRWLTGGKLSEKVEGAIHSVFMILLIGLMLFLMVKDTVGLFK